jgi:hypothetical protein
MTSEYGWVQADAVAVEVKSASTFFDSRRVQSYLVNFSKRFKYADVMDVWISESAKIDLGIKVLENSQRGKKSSAALSSKIICG